MKKAIEDSVASVLHDYCIKEGDLRYIIEEYHRNRKELQAMKEDCTMDGLYDADISTAQCGLSKGDLEADNYKLRTIIEYLEQKDRV